MWDHAIRWWLSGAAALTILLSPVAAEDERGRWTFSLGVGFLSTLDDVRSNAAVAELVDFNNTPDQAVIAAEEWSRVEAAFDQLTSDQREVVTLTRIVGLSHADVGEKLGKKPEAVRQIMHRALVRLSSILTAPENG